MKAISIMVFTILAMYASTSLSIELNVQLDDWELRDQFVVRLDESDVKYKIDSNGTLLYDEKYYREVQKIMDDVVSENEVPVSRSISYSDASVHKAFIEALDKADVPYKTKSRYKSLWVIWAEGYEEEVKLAHKSAEEKIEQLNQQFMQNYKNKNSNKN
jgi:hypothetical protein